MEQKVIINEKLVEYKILKKTEKSLHFLMDNKEYVYCLISKKVNCAIIQSLTDKKSDFKKVLFSRNIFQVEGKNALIEKVKRKRKGQSGNSSQKTMLSPMPGKILKVLVKEGEQVVSGDSLVIMEAMKMEHTIKANTDGLIKTVLFNEGDQVEGLVELVIIE